MKKAFVGAAAILCSIVSILLWVWYAHIPSFDSSNKSFNDVGDNATFQAEVLNDAK